MHEESCCFIFLSESHESFFCAHFNLEPQKEGNSANIVPASPKLTWLKTTTTHGILMLEECLSTEDICGGESEKAPASSIVVCFKFLL